MLTLKGLITGSLYVEIINEEVYENLWKDINMKRDKFAWYVLRHTRLFHEALEGTVKVKTSSGSQILEYKKQISRDVGCRKYANKSKSAENKEAKPLTFPNQSND